MPNPFVHIELTTSDLGAAKKFYTKLFDWKLIDMPTDGGPSYTLIAPGKGPAGGMQAQPMPGAPVTWLPYVEVPDVAKSLAKAEANGATIALPKMDIGEHGVIGIFIDPTGAMLGVWAPGKKAKKPAKKKAAKKKAAKAPAKKKAAKKKASR